MTNATAAAPPSRAADLTAAALLALTALLSLVLILHHPVLHGHAQMSVTDVAHGIVAQAGMNRFVHGALLAVLFVQAIGLMVFARRLAGRTPLLAAAGLLAFVTGALVTVIPAILDGFVTSDLAHGLAAANGCAGPDAGAMRLIALMIQDFTKFGLVAMAVAAGLWAAGLVQLRGFGPRIAAAIGLACAAAPLWLVLGTDLYLSPHSLLAVMAAEVTWCLTAAALLARGFNER